MAIQRHLKNAPIVEAVIDIQVTLPEIEISEIKKAHAVITEQYPKQSERLRGSFTFKPGQPLDTDLNVIGFAFTNPDEKRVVQMRLDGFTYSMLKPYTEWVELRDEAHRLWDLYCKITNPANINRIAVRYINRLELPLPIPDFNKYLIAQPNVPKELPQNIANFLTRILIPIPTSKTFVLITQILEQVNIEKFAPIVLDIDVYEINQEDNILNKANLWEKFEQFRILKNEFFFQSITDETARLYE